MMKLSATLPVGETAISMAHISPLRFRRSLYHLSGEGRMVESFCDMFNEEDE